MKTNTDVTTNIRRGKKPNHNIYEKFLSRMEKKLWGPCKKHYFAKLKVDDTIRPPSRMAVSRSYPGHFFTFREKKEKKHFDCFFIFRSFFLSPPLLH